MKLKNLMSTNAAIRHQTRKVKQHKFGDIGMNLWNKKKSYNNTNHENSQMIEFNNNIST